MEAFDIKMAIEELENIYDNYYYSHRSVGSPRQTSYAAASVFYPQEAVAAINIFIKEKHAVKDS